MVVGLGGLVEEEDFLGLIWCGKCKSPTLHSLVSKSLQIRVLFMPVAKVQKKYHIACLECRNLSDELGEPMIASCRQVSREAPPRDEIIRVVEDIEAHLYALAQANQFPSTKEEIAGAMASRRGNHNPVTFEYVATRWAEMYDRKIDQITEHLKIARRKYKINTPESSTSPGEEPGGFAAIMAALNALLVDVTEINPFRTFRAISALDRAQRRREQLRGGFNEVLQVHEQLIQDQPIDNIGNALQASWMVAGLSHRLVSLRTTWIQVSNEIDQKMALTITILGVYLACVSLVISVVGIVLTLR